MSFGRCASEDEYMEKAFEFLKEYQWIYNSKNTDILTRNVLSNFSREWRDYFNRLSTDEVHDLVRGCLKEPVPSNLKSFITELNYLQPHMGEDCITGDYVFAKHVGISRKKSHEIALLAPVIDEICQKSGCHLVVDVGSGLGHLPHLLHSKYGYPVLALEASRNLVDTARSNQAKFHPKSIGSVVFEQAFVSASSAPHLKTLMDKHFEAHKKVCLTGLHACADLSVEMLKLFADLSNAEALVVMPCCYHRMALAKEEAEQQWFKSFPVSVLAKSLFERHGASRFLRQTFLRLACQQTRKSYVRMSKEEHEKHGQQCLQRAVLQLVAESENCTVRRLKRKSGKSDAADIDGGFQDYLNNLSSTHELVPSSPETPVRISGAGFLSRMHEKWAAHKTDCRQVEVLMGLQGAIQALCENVILLDRVAFLKEKGFRCYKEKITNDALSPRCWALISGKNGQK